MLRSGGLRVFGRSRAGRRGRGGPAGPRGLRVGARRRARCGGRLRAALPAGLRHALAGGPRHFVEGAAVCEDPPLHHDDPFTRVRAAEQAAARSVAQVHLVRGRVTYGTVGLLLWACRRRCGSARRHDPWRGWAKRSKVDRLRERQGATSSDSPGPVPLTGPVGCPPLERRLCKLSARGPSTMRVARSVRLVKRRRRPFRS